MGDYGLAALAGILGGLPSLPAGMLAGQKIDQGQQHLDLQQQHLQQQQNQFDQSKFTDVPSTLLPSGASSMVDATKGTARVPTAMLPYLGAQQMDELKQQRATQDRGSQAAVFRRLAQTSGNANFNALADLMEAGAVKDPAAIYETEKKGEQAASERNYNTALLRSLGIDVPDRPGATPPPATVSAPGTNPVAEVTGATPYNPPDLAEALRGASMAGQTANNAATARNAIPNAPPIAPMAGVPGGGAGGAQGPMPNMPNAFRPDISIKAGPATINLKTPTDERDSYASSMFNGLLFHQLRPDQQQKVLAELPTSPQNRLAQSAAQGENAANLRLSTAEREVLPPSQAAELGVPYGTTQKGAYGTKPLTAQQQNKEGAAKSALAIIDGVQRELDSVAQPTGPLGRIYQAPKNMWGVYAQGDPKLTALDSRIQGTLSTVIRALGEVGTLSDKDIARARSLWPKFVPIPDSAETVAEKMRGLRELVQEVGGRETSAPAPGTPPGQPPAPKAETLSRSDPRYQQLRQRGMTDQQIQSKYGVQIGP